MLKLVDTYRAEGNCNCLYEVWFDEAIEECQTITKEQCENCQKFTDEVILNSTSSQIKREFDY